MLTQDELRNINELNASFNNDDIRLYRNGELEYSSDDPDKIAEYLSEDFKEFRSNNYKFSKDRITIDFYNVFITKEYPATREHDYEYDTQEEAGDLITLASNDPDKMAKLDDALSDLYELNHSEELYKN